MVNNVIAHGADGDVFMCGVTFPGNWHYGSICLINLPFIIDKIGAFKSVLIKGSLAGVSKWNFNWSHH